MVEVVQVVEVVRAVKVDVGHGGPGGPGGQGVPGGPGAPGGSGGRRSQGVQGYQAGQDVQVQLRMARVGAGEFFCFNKSKSKLKKYNLGVLTFSYHFRTLTFRIHIVGVLATFVSFDRTPLFCATFWSSTFRSKTNPLSNRDPLSPPSLGAL